MRSVGRLLALCLMGAWPLPAWASAPGPWVPEVWSVIPFGLLLLAIAVLPLAVPHFWEPNRNKGIVAGLLSVPVLILTLTQAPGALLHSLEEYMGFIVLLWSLYTISGGILLRGNLVATPKVNTAFLAIGAVMANVFGTTGASMLLVRPLLQTNMERRHKTHTFLFFIFLVSNVGGCLTPLGDPPLYMGFLRGIPFTWTLNLFPEWLFMTLALLGVYFAWETRAFRKERPTEMAEEVLDYEPLRLEGKINLLLIAGVLATIVVSGQVDLGPATPFLRDGVMVALGLLSMVLTPRKVREDNRFTFGAIIEVAVLFLGIFITMVPALALLRAKGADLGVTDPWQFFWATGSLSSFLDNTPTYLTFLELAQGTLGAAQAPDLLATEAGAFVLKAISLGAVFMGAMTYIGNGPNFMVKALAEERGPTRVPMPSFGGYLVYSCAILLPLFALTTVLFLMPWSPLRF